MAILSSVIKVRQIKIAMYCLKVAQHHILALLQRNFHTIDLEQLTGKKTPEELQH
jgi:hypothetical protein